jgi:spoIIIJ-associated protein
VEASDRSSLEIPQEPVERVREVVTRVVEALGLEATVDVQENDEEIRATVDGPDEFGRLIGRHGQTIDALQYLANAIAHRDLGAERRRITVDAAGYRSRRAATLEQLAHRSAERAAATGHRVELDPMTAIERKIVHERLQDDPEVETASEGTEPNRYVVVRPRRSVD